MKIVTIIALSTFIFTTNVFAMCDDGSKTIFSCTTKKGKQIEVCDAGKTISYSFGKLQANPEIVVKVPRSKASTSQWAGIGRSESYSIDIPNGKTIYSVFWSLDRLSDEHPIDAGVSVSNNDKLVATVNCSGKNIVNNIEGIALKPSE